MSSSASHSLPRPRLTLPPKILRVEGRAHHLHPARRRRARHHLPQAAHGGRVHAGQRHHRRRLPFQAGALRGRVQPTLGAAQLASARENLRRRNDARAEHHPALRRRELVRARGLRPVWRAVRGPSGSAPHHDRLWVRWAPAAQGLPDDGVHGDPLRRGEEAHRVRAARDDAGLPQLPGWQRLVGAGWGRRGPQARSGTFFDRQ
jgi:hypothetical protein